MINYISNINPIILSLLGGLFTFSITALGSSIVFFFKKINKNIMDSMLSISAGIMISASFFSLLNPAIDIVNRMNASSFLIIFSFLIGGLSIYYGDIIFNNVFKNNRNIYSLKRCIVLFTSITLHNIPEGLVIGVSFGALSNNTIVSSLLLTLAIGIQNFPEGCAISIPLRRDGVSLFNSFLFGALSAIVEPIFAVIGALLVIRIQLLLPFIMSFAAGAMIFVVVNELIPEISNNTKKGLMALIVMIGFSIMMLLELLF